MNRENKNASPIPPAAAITTTGFSYWLDIFLILKSDTVKTLGSFQTYSKWIQWFWSGPNLANEKNPHQSHGFWLLKWSICARSARAISHCRPFSQALILKVVVTKLQQSWDPKRIIRSRKRQCAIHVLFFPKRSLICLECLQDSREIIFFNQFWCWILV